MVIITNVNEKSLEHPWRFGIYSKITCDEFISTPYRKNPSYVSRAASDTVVVVTIDTSVQLPLIYITCALL